MDKYHVGGKNKRDEVGRDIHRMRCRKRRRPIVYVMKIGSKNSTVYWDCDSVDPYTIPDGEAALKTIEQKICTCSIKYGGFGVANGYLCMETAAAFRFADWLIPFLESNVHKINIEKK